MNFTVRDKTVNLSSVKAEGRKSFLNAKPFVTMFSKLRQIRTEAETG